MADQCTYQFSCPSCNALLQAVLKQALTSVQCGECFDVFDVQLPTYAPPAASRPPHQPLLWRSLQLSRGIGSSISMPYPQARASI